MDQDHEAWRKATRRRNLVVLAIVAVLFSPVIYAGICLLPRAIHANAWSGCSEDLSEIARAMRAYSQDWDGRLPPSDRWCDALYPTYLESQGHFACPVARAPYSYAMNSRLSRAKLAEIENPSKTALIFESTKTQRNAHDPLTSRRRDGLHTFEHEGRFVKGGLVLFANFGVGRVPDDEELAP